MAKLTAMSVKNAPPGRHGDGEGLCLLVKPSGAKSWVLRIQADGKRRDVGLGSVDTSTKSAGDEIVSDVPILQRRLLTLAEARQKAALLRKAAKSGLDPVEARDQDRRTVPKFRDAAKAAHLALQSG
ncbi:MAG: Arm DNA-binding domain-containing protein, partial [Alphaproteobacteria bacterium]|nr:Arm DNA-binding domain-containing protein [Alphaproteobacteria bacterium]